jgi:hypothetical protein
MPGIRVDVEWLTRYAGEVRAAGKDVVAAQRVVEAHALTPESFGDVGREAGAADAYARVAALLLGQARRASEVLVHAGNELQEVVDFHAVGDDDSAHELSREQEG